MNLTDYQTHATRTMPADMEYNDRLIMLTLGLAGETGELVEVVKKWRYHGHAIDHNHILSELGDVLWYLTNLANVLGFSMSIVATFNIAKLTRRYPNGFSEEDSQNRS